MLGNTVIRLYAALRDLGLVRSKRDYSRRFLGRGETYLRDFEQRGRHAVRVPANTVLDFKSRLQQISRYLPIGLKAELDNILRTIEIDCQIADLLGYRRRR